MSNTPVPVKWNSSTTYMKLQYLLGGTENGTGSVRQAYQWASHEGNKRSNPISIYAHTMPTDAEYRSLNTICVHIT